MKLFGQLVRTVVNVAILPVDVVKDVVSAPIDVGEGRPVGERTKDRIQKLKDEALEQ
jgi:hypothetical protein